jgi:hypothetical protein
LYGFRGGSPDQLRFGMGWVHCKRRNFAHFSATVVQLQILPMGGGRHIPLFLGSDVTFLRLGGASLLQPLFTAICYWFSSTRMHKPCTAALFLLVPEAPGGSMNGGRRRTIFTRRSFDCFRQQHHDFQARDAAPTESLELIVLTYRANLDMFSRCHSRQVTRLRPKSVEPSQ